MPLPLSLLLPLLLPAAPTDKPAVPPALSRPAAPRPQIRLDLRLTRVDTPAPSTTDSVPATAPPVVPPVTLSTLVLLTLDQETATMSITNPDFGYSIALSPKLENAENTNTASLLALWNLRLSGHALPGGTNVATSSGATRIPLSAGEALLAEMPLRDLKTGQTSLFRLTIRATINSANTTASVGTISANALTASR